MLIKHWWIVAKVRQSNCANKHLSVCPNHKNFWYHFGFNKENGLKGAIRFTKHDTYEDADKSGKISADNTHEEPSTLKSKYIQRPIKAAVEFAEKFDGRYDLAHNNCQIFAEGLYSKLWLLQSS